LEKQIRTKLETDIKASDALIATEITAINTPITVTGDKIPVFVADAAGYYAASSISALKTENTERAKVDVQLKANIRDILTKTCAGISSADLATMGTAYNLIYTALNKITSATAATFT